MVAGSRPLEITLYCCMLAELIDDVHLLKIVQLLVSQAALELFFDEILQGSVLKCHIGIHPLELRKLLLHLFEPF